MAAPPVELWAGVECTVNRVGDRYFDQVVRSGHEGRPEDLDRFAALGVRALRYPVLWERTAPADRGALEGADWSWPDARLARLRALAVRPIVGLVHHGSGPRATSLVDPAFPAGLARYARAVAARYPWVEDFTPINEPLTTARFSGLYGHWYPHGRDTASFVRVLLTECRATVLAMAAIREVTPGARLVQTEDLGATSSTPPLAYQAEHENHRRWLSLDLLTGRVDRDHPLWTYLLAHGATAAELAFFREHATPPDVVGLNYYVTSDRFLDDRSEGYPPWSRGGNGRDAYADVEATRAREGAVSGHRALLERAWRRYGLPLALTEVHLGGPREEQLRWLLEAWRGALAARHAGADLRAITVWSLLGAFDWDTLVVADRGRYESGVFDLRRPGSDPPRATALAGMVRALADGRTPDHPVLATPGWWRRPDRVCYPAGAAPARGPGRGAARPLVITGATGTLGRAFGRVCAARGIPCRLLGHRALDIADPAAVARALDHLAPWAVVNAAGYVRVDAAEREPYTCDRQNARGPAVLAAACRARGARLVTFSSDLVFDGARRVPYVERDAVAPLSVYGRSKAEAERRVLDVLPSALVVRTGAFFGPWDEDNFAARCLRALARSDRFRAAADAVVSPTYVPDLVHACLDLLIDGAEGVWHLVNGGALSWAEFARRSAAAAGLDGGLVEPCAIAALGLPAPRPAYCALGTARGALLPPLDEALPRYVRERAAA